MQVAILSGITMGGGAGISVLGTFHVATNKTVWFLFHFLDRKNNFPGKWFLFHFLFPREYLAMVGDRLNGVEMISCGLATHCTDTTKLPLVEKELENLDTSDAYVVGACLPIL